MSTVSSICATGSVTALSVVGLTLASERSSPSGPPSDMTAACSTLPQTLDAHIASPSPSQRLASEDNDVRQSARDKSTSTRSSNSRGDEARTGHSNSVNTMPGLVAVSRDPTMNDALQQPSSTPEVMASRSPRPSDNVVNGCDSSCRTHDPVSAIYNGSNRVLSPASSPGFATGSVPPRVPPQLPPNKLIKRSASSQPGRDLSSSPLTSRLPVPTLRRPATSRQRSADIQEYQDTPGAALPRHGNDTDIAMLSSPWEHYFVPCEWSAPSRSRSSTGIPNPVRQLVPDRKYVPTLISAKEIITSSRSDNGVASSSQGSVPLKLQAARYYSQSSPLQPRTGQFDEDDMLPRSLSVSDMRRSNGQTSTRRRLRRSHSGSSKSQRLHSTMLPAAGISTSDSSTSALHREAPRSLVAAPLSNRSESQRSNAWSSSSSNYHTSQPDGDDNLASSDQSLHFSPNENAITLSEQACTPSASGLPRAPRADSFSHSSTTKILPEVWSDLKPGDAPDNNHRPASECSEDYERCPAQKVTQTRNTRTASGRRGPHIESIFDDSPAPPSSGRSTRLRDLLKEVPHFERTCHCHRSIGEQDSPSGSAVRCCRHWSGNSPKSEHLDGHYTITSSPPLMDTSEFDGSRWGAAGEKTAELSHHKRQMLNSHSNGTLGFWNSPSDLNGPRRNDDIEFANTTPLRTGWSPSEGADVFDWVEQQSSPSNRAKPPPRPRTVHGKKDREKRFSRSAGRRPMEGQHARSHSVPVLPGIHGERTSVIANKFGTWGVGSKAVTEDWNEDFDFHEHLPASSAAELDERRIDSGHEMFVPPAIREQQEIVVANINLLREWGLLIEELKELRVRAMTLQNISDSHAHAWREADAMIELADQETEEETLQPRRSPPSSPGVDYSLFDETPRHNEEARAGQRRANLSELTASNVGALHAVTFHTTRVPMRPRRDSELVAQRVIAALQSRTAPSDVKKLPFDTATLRHIVLYVNGLARKIKEAIHESEDSIP